jgi:hypothetical protein
MEGPAVPPRLVPDLKGHRLRHRTLREPPPWTEEAGETRWYLFDLGSGEIADDPTQIVKLIRSTPETPRKHDLPEDTLSQIRLKIEKHIKNTYLKQVQAPIGVKPKLKAWMELS